MTVYCKNRKTLDNRSIAVIILKLEQYHFFYMVTGPKDADGMANRSGSTLFAQTCLSENLN